MSLYLRYAAAVQRLNMPAANYGELLAAKAEWLAAALALAAETHTQAAQAYAADQNYFTLTLLQDAYSNWAGLGPHELMPLDATYHLSTAAA